MAVCRCLIRFKEPGHKRTEGWGGRLKDRQRVVSPGKGSKNQESGRTRKQPLEEASLVTGVEIRRPP